MGLATPTPPRCCTATSNPPTSSSAAAGAAKLGDFGTGTFKVRTRRSAWAPRSTWRPRCSRGVPTSLRSDVYSLGVLAYEVVTGERPFVGADLRGAHGRPPALPAARTAAVRPEVGKALASVVAKALARDPARRYASWRRSSPRTARPPAWRRPAPPLRRSAPPPRPGGAARAAAIPAPPPGESRGARRSRTQRTDAAVRRARARRVLVAVRTAPRRRRAAVRACARANPECCATRSGARACRIGIGTSPI